MAAVRVRCGSGLGLLPRCGKTVGQRDYCHRSRNSSRYCVINTLPVAQRTLSTTLDHTKNSSKNEHSSSSSSSGDRREKLYVTLGGIGTDIFNRLCETVFTRVVLGLQTLRPERPGMFQVHMPLYDFNTTQGTNDMSKMNSVNSMILGDSTQTEGSECVHTGVLATMMDHCGGICAWTLLTRPSQLVATIDLQTDYLIPIPVRYFDPQTNADCAHTDNNNHTNNNNNSDAPVKFNNNGYPTVFCESNVVFHNDKFVLCDIGVYESINKQIKYASGRGLYNIYTSPITRIHIPILSNFALFKKYVNAETVTQHLPPAVTTRLVRWIETFIIWKLKRYPKKYVDDSVQEMKSALSQQQSLEHNNRDSNSCNSMHLAREYVRKAIVRIENPKTTLGKWPADDPLKPLADTIDASIASNSFAREVFDLRFAYHHKQEIDGSNNNDDTNNKWKWRGYKLVTVLPFKKRFIGNFLVPCVHGGVTAALMEYVGFLCAKSAVEQFLLDNNKPVSVSTEKIPSTRVNTEIMKVSYLKPTPCEHMICEATVSDFCHEEGLMFVDMVVYESSYATKLSMGSGVYRVDKMQH
jgi:acyl-coenzyme A thioesterase PaaI-like protein